MELFLIVLLDDKYTSNSFCFYQSQNPGLDLPNMVMVVVVVCYSHLEVIQNIRICECKRETERERQTERQRDRQTETN